MRLRLGMIAKRRGSVLALRTIVRLGAKKRLVPTLELRSNASRELTFARSTVRAQRVDDLAGGLLRWPPFTGVRPSGWFTDGRNV